MEIKFQDKRYQDAFLSMTKHRSIFLTEVFQEDMASIMTASLVYLDSVSHDLITIYINSPGGMVSSLNQVYDTMQMINSPISTVCIGRAYSAGSVILASGTKGLRKCMQNANVMIHGMQLGFPNYPNHDLNSARRYLEYCNKLNDSILQILADHTGQSISKIQEDCDRDVFFTAKDALSYGLIDEII